ncbi:MAG: DegT/DnrJ/EryC1/StrS family aminotransferase [Magnetococcales bacterium]|nr:DegT/DnrJ/EryC1/StrS family aminotransferase [Magnetococcales bacterium]
MNDLTREPEPLRRAMTEAVERVISSGSYVLDREVERFERSWAERCGVRFGVGVGNGMDALEIALQALGIGPGDEVIVPAMTAFASVLAVIRAGATPVLADIDEETALLSLESVRRVISGRSRALMVVHLYGRLERMNAWVSFCHDHGLVLIEDCAQAHLASRNGAVAGSFGRVGAFSFYPTKNLGALGDAGMLITDDETIARKARQWRDYGRSVSGGSGLHLVAGLNSRLDELQAALLSARLPWLEGFNAARRAIAMLYAQGIHHPGVRLPPMPEESDSHVHHLFVVNSPQRDALQTHLNHCGVKTGSHYPLPVHWHPACGNPPRDPLGLRRAERHAESCLSLPCHPFLEGYEVERVVDSINRFIFTRGATP